MKTMSTRKKIIAGTIVLFMIAHVLHYGIHSFYENHRYGQILYEEACRLQTQSKRLADCIDYLERELPKADYEIERVNSPMFTVFLNSLSSIHSHWGYDDFPISEEVRYEYWDNIHVLRRLTLNDPGYTQLSRAFADEAQFNEFVLLKNQLYALCDNLEAFELCYRQMSPWDRCFTSWEDEQAKLTEQVRLP